MSRDRWIPRLDPWHQPFLRFGQSFLPCSAGVRDPRRFLRRGWGRMSPRLSELPESTISVPRSRLPESTVRDGPVAAVGTDSSLPVWVQRTLQW